MNTAGDGTAQGSRFFDDDGLDETSKRLDDRDRRGREKAQETLRLREAAIISPDVSPEDKARAVMDAAGEILMQTAEEGRKESRRQYDEAYDRYHDTDGKPLDGWLKAPNGKDTNLNEHQWAMVRTQNFKKWFGDWENKPEESSKVIDANGEPQVVYHGTNADFNVFDSEKQGTKSGALNPARGFFFTPDPGRAALYGDTVKAFFLNAKADRREARKQGLARDYIQQGEDFIVFSPAQIKSATDNAGTFNGDNPSILFQTEDRDIIFKQYHNADGTPKEGWLKAPNGKESNLTTYDPTGKLWVTVRTENFKKWFGDWEKNPDKASKIVDENGEPTQVFHGTRTEFEAFSLEKTGTRRDPGKLGKGFYFSTDKYAASAGDPITLALFASAKDPLYLKMDKWTQDKSETVSKALGFEGAKDSETIRDKLIQSGYDAVVLDYSPLGYNHQELMMLNPEQIKSATDNIGTFDTDNPSFLFQDGDRDMMEEAAGFENGKDYRGYVEAFSELPQEVEGFTDEQIDAWFEEFVRKSKQAANSREQAEGTTGTETATPAELDREFIELIGEPGELQNFVELLAATYNEDYGQWQAADEEDMANRDRWAEISDNLRRKFTHPTWQSIFKAGGRMGPTQQKQVLTMIRNSPREYRAIYADITERPDMAVSAEDSTAAALKHRITDSRRQDVDSLTPEKMRQLAEQLDIEDFAEKVRTGHAQFDDPVERAYIKQLQDQRRKLENDLKEIDDDRQEDNNFIERLAGKEFNDAFERAIKAHEQITRKHSELDRAIKEGRRSTSRIAWQLQRQNANYNTIIQSLEALASAHQLELDIQKILSDEKLKDYAKSAKTEATLTVRLARKAERDQIRTHIAEIKKMQEAAKELTQAKRGVTRRILRPINPREVNAEQGRAVAIIQRLVEPSMLEGIDRFIGGIEKPYLRTIFETWKVDEQLRAGILKNKAQATADKMTRILNKERFEDLTNGERKYLYLKIPPNDWAVALGLESIIKRRNQNFPMNGETEQQIALKYLAPDLYYRIMDKPFSEWTLEEGEELAKVIDDLIVQGKEVYKANIDAEQKRIGAYQTSVRNTIRTVNKAGLRPEEIEKIIGRYDYGVAGTAAADAKRRASKGPLLGYADMNIYRFARMLDNGDANGKNSAALYRRASDAYNQEMTVVDYRTERIQKRMKELGITDKELWQKTAELNLGGDLGIKPFTAAELLGFLSATRDDYSREAVLYGNMLTENERAPYQRKNITNMELTPMYEIAEQRYAQVEAAAQKIIADNPNYQKLMDAIDEDFTEGGQRLSEALVRYNNTYMPIVDKYFPIHRQAAVNINSADAQLARDLMGGSSGAFNLFVEKGFTNERQNIPAQYQTAIKLDILGVWAEAASREEHFMAYGQLIKDLNAIYKQNRPVKDAIQRRYGQQAVDYINKYINELANPNHEKTRSAIDNFVRSMRGNTAAAYLSWKVSGIAKQFITSPAPFFAYMNPLEYWGTFIEYAAHQETTWQEITQLSPHMAHRSANLLVEMVKENAKQKFDNKADSAISRFNQKGMEGLTWIDRMCVAPGWLVLYRKEYSKLTNNPANANMNEKDIRVKAAQYADDIIRLTQPSARADDLAPLFKGNNELGKALLQFTASLNVIWQNARYDLPQMIRERRYKNAAGTIIGYTLAGIMLGAITAGFDDDDDEASKMKKIAWWATTQFTDSFPIIGSEMTRLAEYSITGKMRYQGGMNLLPIFQKIWNATAATAKGLQEKDFEKLLKASAQAAEALGIYKGLPVSGIKEAGSLLGIGDEEEGLNLNPGALTGRR